MANCLDFGDPSSTPGVEDVFEPLAPAEVLLPELTTATEPQPQPDALTVRRRWQRPTSRDVASAGGDSGPYHLGPPLPGALVYTDFEHEDLPPAAAPPEDDEMMAATEASDEEPLSESSGEEAPAEPASPTSRKTGGIRRIESYLSEDTSADERPQETPKEEAVVHTAANPDLELRHKQATATVTKSKVNSATWPRPTAWSHQASSQAMIPKARRLDLRHLSKEVC
ncbi:unnamed protein product [Symbiodinium sp. CCMP2592]|nr:unnamed protein product [Symbiodinium sp. CCMP2592]